MKKTLAALAAAALASLGALSAAPTASAAGGQDEQAVAHDVKVADSYHVDGGSAMIKGPNEGLPTYYEISGGELRADGTGVINLSRWGVKTEAIHVTTWQMGKYTGYMTFMHNGAPYHGQLLPMWNEDWFEGEFTGLDGTEIDFEPIVLLPA
ncbi:MAG: hypothetical protein AAGA42_18560 [Actinomycetota bacterium]